MSNIKCNLNRDLKMNNHQQMNAQLSMDLMKQFFGQEHTFTIPRMLVKLLGSHVQALLLNQMIFWGNKKKDGWFWKTYAQWLQELDLSKRQVMRTIDKFITLGFIQKKVKKVGNVPVNWFKVNFDLIMIKCQELFGSGSIDQSAEASHGNEIQENDHIEGDKMSLPLEGNKVSLSYNTEDYTEDYKIHDQQVDQECEKNESKSVAKTKKKTDRAELKKLKEERLNLFLLFWSAYPKKVAKKRAQSIYMNKELYNNHAVIMEDLRKRKQSEWSSIEKQFIPHPSSYLNGERWNDEEIIENKPTKTANSTKRWTLEEVMNA